MEDENERIGNGKEKGRKKGALRKGRMEKKKFETGGN